MQVPKQEAIQTSRDNPVPEAYRNIECKRKDRERSTVGTVSALHTCYQTGWQSGCTANEKLGVTHMEAKWDQGVEAYLPFAPAPHAWTSPTHPQQMNIVPRDPGVLCTALTDCSADLQLIVVVVVVCDWKRWIVSMRTWPSKHTTLRRTPRMIEL